MKAKRQAKKTLATVLAACMLTSGMATGVSAYYEDEDFNPANHSLGVTGSFNDWGYDSPDIVMTDEDGDGVYVAAVDTSDYYTDDTYYFKIRADEEWNYNWGSYEEDYDRTFNSQTNFEIDVVEESTVFYVYLDTTGEDMYVWNCGWTLDPSEVGVGVSEVKTTEDGLRYVINDGKEVTITAYTGSATDITIPDTIENLPVTKLRDGLFRNNYKIKSVKLPANLKIIPQNTFNGCSGLEKVTVPSGLTEIGQSAFCECTDLTSIDLPASVSSIGSYSFAYSGLKSFTVPSGVTSLNYSTFASCGNLASVTLSKNLTSIGSCAFEDCQSLTAISIPDTVDTIGYSAFYGCRSLKDVNIPSALTEIDEGTFQSTAIESVVISDSVEYISYNAFSNCSSLKSVTIGAEVSSIYESSFNYCPSIESFTVSADNSYYSVANGVLFNKDKTNLILYPAGKADESYTVPNTVNTIQSYAFSGSKLTKISLPGSVTDINPYAFYNSGLTAVTLPSSVTYLGYSAFSNCKDLKTVKLGKNIKSIPENCFYQCSSLSNVTFGTNLKAIYEYAFYDCDALRSIAIPEGVTVIGYDAFCDCDALETVTFPSTLNTISSEAFYGCDMLSEVVLPENIESVGYGAFSYCEAVKSISINSDVDLENSVFYDDYLIEKIYFGKNVTKIDLSKFELNENTEIVIDPENTSFVIEDNVLYSKDKTKIFSALPKFSVSDYTVPSTVITINDRAFSSKPIEKLTIPASVKTIGEGAFRYCGSLKTAVINAKLTEISSSMFSNCSALEEINIPDTVTAINSYAFVNCDSLKKVAIPDSVKTIGYEAFESCGSLETVMLGKSVETIGDEAFEYCYNLRSIIIPASVTFIGYDAFYSDYNLVIYGEADSYAESYANDHEKSFEEYAELENFSFVYEPVSNLGTPVNIRCLADGGIGRYSFECAVKPEGAKSYTVIQEFGKNKKIVYKPAKTGKYDLRVRVRDDFGTIVSKTTSFEVINSTLNNLSSVSATEVLVGQEVQITGKADGGTAPYTYSYYFKRSTNTTWKAIKENTTSAVASVTPTAEADYDVKVVVKDSSGTTSEKLFTIKAKAANSLFNTSVINSDVVKVGDKVRVAASATGGTAPYKYSYYYKRSTNTSWKVLGTENGTNSSVTFTPTAEADYDVKVVVSDSKGAASEKLFTVKAMNDLPLTNVSTIYSTKVKIGSAAKITGKAVGGTSPYTYAFYFKRSTNSTWKVLGTEFTTESTARLKPTAAAEYDIKVVVMDANKAKETKVFKITAY